MSRCELVKPLTIIINQMLHTRIFPEQLKISKVFPLHDKMSLTNYMPIALLSSISKIFECVLLNQIINHFTDNNLLSPQQYGLCTKHSTELAALNLVYYLTHNPIWAGGGGSNRPAVCFMCFSKFNTYTRILKLRDFS